MADGQLCSGDVTALHLVLVLCLAVTLIPVLMGLLIRNRIDMLATGNHSPAGVKVAGLAVRMSGGRSIDVDIRDRARDLRGAVMDTRSAVAAQMALLSGDSIARSGQLEFFERAMAGL